jgi:hypothetical protein
MAVSTAEVTDLMWSGDAFAASSAAREPSIGMIILSRIATADARMHAAPTGDKRFTCFSLDGFGPAFFYGGSNEVNEKWLLCAEK